MMKYQIGNLYHLDADSDPTFDTLEAALEAVEERADLLSTAVWGIWEVHENGWPDLIVLAHAGDVFWQDGYTVRVEGN